MVQFRQALKVMFVVGDSQVGYPAGSMNGLGFLFLASADYNRVFSFTQIHLQPRLSLNPTMWRPGAWNNTVNPPVRDASPLPLHTNHSPSPLPGRRPGGRPQLSHKTSSLSLASSANASTTSLSGSVRGQQSSGLRRAATVQVPPGIRDPLDVLEGILGVQVKPSIEADTDQEVCEVPDLDEVEDIDFGELSLEAFVEREERREADDRELQVRARNHTVNTMVDCELPLGFKLEGLLTWIVDEREQGKFVDLHRSIKVRSMRIR